MIISSNPPLPSPFWIHSLQLNPNDELELVNGLWLTDRHIVAAQKLLKIHHSNINGLEDPLLLAERFQYKSTATSFVQIINLSRTHWVCASSINCPLGIVDVYDSMPACSFGSLSLKRQVAVILKTMSLALNYTLWKPKDNQAGRIVASFQLHLLQHCVKGLTHMVVHLVRRKRGRTFTTVLNREI